jgi:hypothetical protein
VTAADIARLLRFRYPLPEWALVFELRNGTGYGRQDRYADGAAWNCYPSKGLHRLAFEIKVSRADFARELGEPMKRRWLEQHFHETWFVAAAGVAKEEELPEGWGLMVATKDVASLRVVRHAPHRDYQASTGPELSALRSLADSLHKQQFATYHLEAGPITEAQLVAIVEDRCKAQRECLTRATVDARKARQEADDARSALEGPIRELMAACGLKIWGLTPVDIAAFARKGLREYLDLAVSARLSREAEALRVTHEALGELTRRLDALAAPVTATAKSEEAGPR